MVDMAKFDANAVDFWSGHGRNFLRSMGMRKDPIEQVQPWSERGMTPQLMSGTAVASPAPVMQLAPSHDPGVGIRQLAPAGRKVVMSGEVPADAVPQQPPQAGLAPPAAGIRQVPAVIPAYSTPTASAPATQAAPAVAIPDVKTEPLPEPELPSSRRGLFGQGGMSQDQLIRLAGGLARSIAPNEWGGRMGNELVTMADASIADQKELDRLKYQQDMQRFNTADNRVYSEKTGLRDRAYKVTDDDKETAQRLKELDLKFQQQRALQSQSQSFQLANREPKQQSEWQYKMGLIDKMNLTPQEKKEAVFGIRDAATQKPYYTTIENMGPGGIQQEVVAITQDATGTPVQQKVRQADSPQAAPALTPDQQARAVKYFKAHPTEDKNSILKKVVAGEI